MTQPTPNPLPADLAVRVRDALMAYHELRVNPLRIGELETLMDDLTAHIEQQRECVGDWTIAEPLVFTKK